MNMPNYNGTHTLINEIGFSFIRDPGNASIPALPYGEANGDKTFSERRQPARDWTSGSAEKEPCRGRLPPCLWRPSNRDRR
jgi:hypothetical protein